MESHQLIIRWDTHAKLDNLPLRYLNKLSLSGNAFGGGGIESSDFLLLTMLTELELRGCDMRVIPDDAFYGVAQHLALLDLANNGLQRIPTGALAPLKKLRYRMNRDSPLGFFPRPSYPEMYAGGKMNKERRIRDVFGERVYLSNLSLWRTLCGI